MSSKSIKTFVASSVIFAALVSPVSTFATEETIAPVTEEQSNLLDLTQNEADGVENLVIVEDYDTSGNVTSTTTYDDGEMTTVDVVPVFGPDGKRISGQPSSIPVTEPGLSYTLIDTFTGDSKVISTLGNWTYQFGAAVIPALITKNVWTGAAAGATYNVFLPPPSTKYYKTWIYQTRDSYYYYGKSVAKKYSDSARTKLEKTVTHISRVPR
ncbi:hypothetical protein ACTSEZ_07515 [Metabacillus sp. JX24]|uniref:hypothetical protein n=1 Tax=Metabacillus sp. JX24 TaxID=3240759 RepID=UPI00351019E1